jgi:hypothetical protein
MSTVVTVTFDGRTLLPESPLDLKPNTQYVVTIEPLTIAEGDAWDVLEAMTGVVDAPEDWAAEHDHYLYGTPKRADKKDA